MSRRSRNRGTQGFTLLELLMVVIIIGILASIALPQYLRVAERSRASEALTMLAAMRASELRFQALSGTAAAPFTTTLANLDTDIPAATPIWTYSVTGTGPGSNGRATRTVGGAQIEIDLTAGTVCTNNAADGATYGINDTDGC